VAAQSISRVVGVVLRTIVIFALIHQPILSLSLVALAAQCMRLKFYCGVTSAAVNLFIDSFLLAFTSASARNSRLCAD
jgi:hypothetical protein